MFKTKIRHHLSIQRLIAAATLVLLIAASQAWPLVAQSFIQGYDSDQSLGRGTIVKLKADDTSKVEPATIDSAELTHGIVVNANDAPVTLSAEGKRVFVAASGQFEVLVSDQSGPITSGDYISISALPGIGMRTDEQQSIVVGKALENFDGQNGVIGTTDIKDGAGNDRKLRLGRVRLDIGIAPSPLLQPTQANLPGFLQEATEAIAGKQVSPERVYLSLGVFLATAVLAGSILYAGTRSGITALGRNPLSKGVINRSLLQMTLISLIILLGGVFTVYLLLKL